MLQSFDCSVKLAKKPIWSSGVWQVLVHEYLQHRNECMRTMASEVISLSSLSNISSSRIFYSFKAFFTK